MIKIENFEVVGMEHAIRGMRNPKNSWDKSDSVKVQWNTHCIGDSCAMAGTDKCSTKCHQTSECGVIVGKKDHKLMSDLSSGGPVHAKYRRMIVVYLDITAPLYWWKEFDTYRVGVTPNPTDIEMNSCSTMHKIHDKKFTLEDFSCEHLMSYDSELEDYLDECSDSTVYLGAANPGHVLNIIIGTLNYYRMKFIETGDKKYWWQMIQLLPSSYNQKRTIMLNYEVLTGIYKSRKDHKLDEWREFCKWIEQLPYSEIITGVRDVDMSKIRQKNYGTKEE